MRSAHNRRMIYQLIMKNTVLTLALVVTSFLVPTSNGQEKRNEAALEPSLVKDPVPAKDPVPRNAASEKVSPGKLSINDATFVTENVQKGLMAIELDHAALQKASKPSVKNFAERLLRDHTKANEELIKLASRKGMTVSKEMSEKQKQMVDQISKLSGEEFDAAYLAHMLKGHSQSIAHFERASQTGTDPEIQTFAKTTLPTLKEHLRMARELNPGQPLNESAGAELPTAPLAPKPKVEKDLNLPSNLDKPNTPEPKVNTPREKDSPPDRKPLNNETKNF